MKEITDNELATLRKHRHLYSVVVRQLLDRLDRVEGELNDARQIVSDHAGMQDRLDRYRSELEIYRLEETCMCGSPMKSHTWGDGHSPVSQLDYHMGSLQEENTALRERVKELTQCSPSWYDASPADAFMLLKKAQERVKELDAKLRLLEATGHATTS